MLGRALGFSCPLISVRDFATEVSSTASELMTRMSTDELNSIWKVDFGMTVSHTDASLFQIMAGHERTLAVINVKSWNCRTTMLKPIRYPKVGICGNGDPPFVLHHVRLGHVSN